MDLLLVTPEEKKKIHEYYNVDEKQIKEDVMMIKSWKEKQPHLPDTLTDDLIEKILLRNKFRVERTKHKLDNYYSLRGLYKDLIQNLEKVIPSQEATTYLPLPKLIPNLERLVIVKIMDADPDHYEVIDLVKFTIAVQEVRLLYDHDVGTRIIYDAKGVTLRHMMKWNPLILTRLSTLVEKAYSSRIVGLECLNLPSFANKMMAIFKLALRPKLYDRIMIHENLESLYKVVPKEYLTSEYGGTVGTIPDLLKKWDKAIESHKDYLEKSYESVSLEHLRPVDMTDEKYGAFGVDGTFKKLAID